MRKKGKVTRKKRVPVAGREYCDTCSYGQGYCGIRMTAPLRLPGNGVLRIASLTIALSEMLKKGKRIKIVSCSDWTDPKKSHPSIRTVGTGEIRISRTKSGYIVERPGRVDLVEPAKAP